ncbi:MAG: PHP domain-containing protein [Desulfobacterales bacterium]|jgi:predicted metal-dependent phosphoesterase TrpH|nr:PHP domain-containing protein [Desulfobacterales bacterium]
MDTVNKIQFEKPDIHELNRAYTVADLHFHTHYSDGVNSVHDIARQAEALGIGIAITDHNDIQGAVEIDKCKRILSIPGIEITSREGSHLLVYFYDVPSLKAFYREDLKPYMGNGVMSSTLLEMEDIIRRARRFKTVIMFPHPYCAAYTGVCNLQFPKERLERLFHMADGVEVINAGNINKWNLQCAVLGFNLGKGIVGGSDGHSLPHMGRALTYAECNRTRKGLLDAIRKKQTKVIGKEMPFIRKVTSNSRKLKKNLRHYPDLMEKNLRYGCTLINAKSRTFRDNVMRSINERLEKVG